MLPSQGKYRILDEGELNERQQDAVRSVTSVLSVSDADASRVLRLFKWYACGGGAGTCGRASTPPPPITQGQQPCQ